MKNILKKTNKEFVVIEKEDGKKFTLKKSEEEKIIIYNEEMITKVIDKKFNKKYRELLYLVMCLNENDDSSDSDRELCLIKIDDLRNLVLAKYQRYLNKEMLNRYLKMLLLLEEKLRLRKYRGR